ncbi:MAG TPA: PPC domain-containing protein, partial [Terriglobia bacterium]|nr:PPC domain-containing protein [Terriglobia bacterium]
MRVTSFSLCVLPMIYLLATAGFLYGEDNLQPGIPVERKIAAGQSHTYDVSLQQDQFLRLVLEQKGIDLGIVVLAPDGRRIGDYDSSSGTYGVESVALVAESAGIYRLKVLPLDEFRHPNPGRYEIRIAELRSASDRELNTGRTQQLLRTKAVVVLNEVLSLIPSLHNSLQRTEYEIEVSRMLWDFDPKFATDLLHRAAEKLRETILASHDSSAATYNLMSKLRQKVIDQMADHEPETALAFVRSTRHPDAGFSSVTQEGAIELSIANKLVAFNPQAAFQIAEDRLKLDFSPAILTTVEKLRSRNPELASILMRHVMARLSSQPLIEVPANASMAAGVVQFIRPGEGVLPDAELRGLLQKMTAEVVAYMPPEKETYSFQRQLAINMVASLKQVKGAMQPVSPEQLASIELRLIPKIAATEYPNSFILPAVRLSPEEEANEVHRKAIEKSISERNFEDVFQHLDQMTQEERPGLIEDILDAIGTSGPGLKKS